MLHLCSVFSVQKFNVYHPRYLAHHLNSVHANASYGKVIKSVNKLMATIVHVIRP